MRHITIPPSITLEGDKPETIDFKKFLTSAVEGYALFGKGLSNIRKGTKILATIEEAKDAVVLEDEHFNCLKDAVDAMQWAPKFAMKAIAFFEAIEKAESVPTK